MQELELLAPAKNLAYGKAAIDHGADAVYIGPERFGARAAAGNSIDDIRQLCRYAHIFGARVYATVNTLIHDEELVEAQQLIHALYDARVDAVLIQDLRLLQTDLPPIAIHASTQTDNRTAQRVEELRQLGLKRVVLARELSVEEIANIHRQVPQMPLEVFVHGALCVSYSGICYASEYCFQRSANRGECAQFCRMPFDLIDADGNMLQQQRHLLSLKDLNLSQHLGELIEAGATSFKIEGRLKDEAYVKNVTAAYSQQLNDFIRRHPGQYRRSSRGYCRYMFQPMLEKTFNRGFTTYFLHGRQPDMSSPLTPKALGEHVGYVKDIRRDGIIVAGTASFSNGDGICFFNDNRQLEGFRVNRAEGNRLVPQQMPITLKRGTILYRNSDQAFERLLTRQSSERKIPISMHLGATPTGFYLRSGDTEVSISCPHQTADKPQHDNIQRQLSRLGGTPYEAEAISIDEHFPWFIPSSRLAELRHLLIDQLMNSEEDVASPCHVPLPHHPTCQSSAFQSKRSADTPLMQCRYCLRHAMGYCTKHGGKQPIWHEPLSLRLADGRRFPLQFDCKRCQMNVLARMFVVLIMMCINFGCYNPSTKTIAQSADMATLSTADSTSSFAERPASVLPLNYNLLVSAATIQLTDAPGLEAFDTIYISKGERLVIADVAAIPTDTIDSVWVKVARDQLTQGWIRQSEMLAAVSPDDPISQFIDFFSDTHLLIFLALCVLVTAAYSVRLLLRHNAPIVHFHDIPSPYPTLLCILVAFSATLYASIQMFDAPTWQHFYFHPSLNPFSLPLHLGIFVASVWAILVVTVAAVEDTRRHLDTVSNLLYIAGLAAVCAACYVVFSVLTLYYIGYLLLPVYIVYALWRYYHYARSTYRCGKCGAILPHDQSVCPRCGAKNSCE